MKIILFLLLITTLYAKKQDTCYTVQLLSIPLSQKARINSQLHKYHKECQLMEIGKTLTMRCGCHEHIKDASVELQSYEKVYKNASLAVSYKYRFSSDKTNPLQTIPEQNHTQDEDSELRFMLQTFLYSQDLKHALQTARIGVQEYPNSLYWNQKMAEILRWLGKSEEAFGYMKYVYNRTKEPKLANEIIDYALASYQYENVQKFVKDAYIKEPNQKNKKRMIYIYHQIGEPQKAAILLEKQYKKKADPQLLTDSLQIYMDLEDLENSKRIITLIEKEHLYSTKNIELISYYYYINHDIQKSYAVLKYYDPSKPYEKRMNELTSDLGWYLQKYDIAAQASLTLIKHKDDRLVDYERVIYVNKKRNPSFAIEMTLQAYKKYHTDYLFYSFANETLKAKEIDLLQKTIDDIDNSNSQLKMQANYWLIKARLYQALGEKEKTVYALKKALQLEPDNIIVSFQALDVYMQLSMYSEVRIQLNNLTRNPKLPQGYFLIIAGLYYAIHDINQASFYLQKLKQYNSTLQNTSEFLFLEDDIYKAQFNENAHIQILRKLRKLYENKYANNPKLQHNDRYLYDSLRISLDLDQVDIFHKKLQEAKIYLSKEHYNNLSYAYAVKIGATDLAHKIYIKTKKAPIWLDFADALLEQEHATKENLLLYHLHELPRDDASYAAHQVGQISLAQDLAFSSLQENEKNKNAYISLLNYSKERNDLLTTKASHYSRDPLLRKYITLDSSTYLNQGVYVFAHLNYYQNTSVDDNILIYVPSTSTDIYGGIKKIFNKGKIIASLGRSSSLADYYTANLAGEYKINNYFNIKAEVAKNATAEESVQLLLGGMKDMLSFTLVYNILPSTALEVRVDQNKYNSQDGVYIGDGTYATASLGYQIRNGYPDMRISLFTDYGNYTEQEGDKGVIEKLRNEDFKVLPNNFNNLGVIFNYGMQNSVIYTRVWRPYFEVSSYYSSEINGLSYGVNAGYGGKVYNQDHLVFGVNYTSDVSGVGGSILELFVNYQFLYTH